MALIGLLSDTHNFLPKEIYLHFKDVDEIWHAGDIGNVALADELEKFKPLKAVYGNIDGADIRVRYPEDLIFNIGGCKIYMTHIAGSAPNYNTRVKAMILQESPNIFVCGHSHIVKIMPIKNLNLLHVNPGACGKQGWHKVKTLVRMTINLGKVEKLELIEL